MEFFHAHAAGSLRHTEKTFSFFSVPELFVTDLSRFFFFLRSHSPKEPEEALEVRRTPCPFFPIPPLHQSPYRVMLRCRFALPSISPYPL
jgi:hypothetical protein